MEETFMINQVMTQLWMKYNLITKNGDEKQEIVKLSIT